MWRALFAALFVGSLCLVLLGCGTEQNLIRDGNKLEQIAMGFACYLNEYGDNRWYPTSLAELFDKKIVSEGELVSPLDNDPPKLANGVPCSYVSCFDKYPNHHFRGEFPPNVPLAWDRKPFVEGKRVLVFMDTHVEWVDEARFQEEMQKLDREVQRAMKAHPEDKGNRPTAPARKPAAGNR